MFHYVFQVHTYKWSQKIRKNRNEWLYLPALAGVWQASIPLKAPWVVPDVTSGYPLFTDGGQLGARQHHHRAVGMDLAKRLLTRGAGSAQRNQYDASVGVRTG